MIISTVSLKGGAGKTTISINLAVYFANLGYKVVIVDADVNGNIKRWNDAREQFNAHLAVIDYIVLNNEVNFKNDFKSYTEPYDIVIIDGRPAIDKMALYILNISDFAIFPIIPSPLDMWTNDDVFIDTYFKAKETNNNLKAAFVMNRINPGTNLFYECKIELNGYKANTDIITLESVLSDRIDYAGSLADGLGAIETKNLKAKGEIKLLGDEIINLLKI